MENVNTDYRTATQPEIVGKFIRQAKEELAQHKLEQLVSQLEFAANKYYEIIRQRDSLTYLDIQKNSMHRGLCTFAKNWHLPAVTAWVSVVDAQKYRQRIYWFPIVESMILYHLDSEKPDATALKIIIEDCFQPRLNELKLGLEYYSELLKIQP